MKAAIWVQDSFRALPRYLFVLTAVSALALLARAAVPSSVSSASSLPDSFVSADAAPFAAQPAAAPWAPAFALQSGVPAPLRPDSRLPAYADSSRRSRAMQTPFSATER
ncbi:hypothetical protein J5226_12185 [Lysobacter sp. K5869]|uniref:hypothetical protein n=1 Tax=Lysobacter sp. K5869 TaxID=2820808 RepID=UPI001C061A85|nr:hypothetical protein [Lysobacter sp. K5869]QWP79092.1 hypothetical protein J5226_12185 [Lysobacter sp. K5869]